MREEEAKFFAESEMGPDGGEGFGIDTRHIDGVADFAVE